jgi:hypothetical protein
MDTLQMIIFDYASGTIIKNQYSSQTQGFGPGTGASLFDINRKTATINGGEAVRLLGAHSDS